MSFVNWALIDQFFVSTFLSLKTFSTIISRMVSAENPIQSPSFNQGYLVRFINIK